MSQTAHKIGTYIFILMLTVGVICSCCSCAVSNSNGYVIIDNNAYADKVSPTEFRTPDIKPMGDVKSAVDCVMHRNMYSSATTYLEVCRCYSQWLNDNCSENMVTRLDWIVQLVEHLGLEGGDELRNKYDYISDVDLFFGDDAFLCALENGILPKKLTAFNPYETLTREYAAYTLSKAIGYKDIPDVDFADKKSVSCPREVSNCLYFCFFELDDNGKFDPMGTVTRDEIADLMKQVDDIIALQGKKILSFGDSIMHGDGNKYVGISDLIAQKYKMTAADYSVGGATFGAVSNRVQICDQILDAISKNETADVILINGGTNDMRKCRPGEISDDFEYESHGRSDFASGMEYALGIIKDNFPNVPVLYVRAHNMVFSPEVNEIYFGNMELEICKKWSIPYADVFSDTDFNTHNTELKNKYTACLSNSRKGVGDSVHPNRIGYYKYYVPLTVDKLADLNI